MEDDASGSATKVGWGKLQPVLAETLGELNEADRDAVWLRFFEERSFAEVGARLRLTENAARMRVERALDKLHGLLARRGVTSTAAAVGRPGSPTANAELPRPVHPPDARSCQSPRKLFSTGGHPAAAISSSRSVALRAR